MVHYSRVAPIFFLVIFALGVLSFSSHVLSMSSRPGSEHVEGSEIFLTKVRFTNAPDGLEATLSALSTQDTTFFKGKITEGLVISIDPPVTLDISKTTATRFPLELPGSLVTPYLHLSGKKFTPGESYMLTVSLEGYYPFGPGQVPILTLSPASA